MNKEYEETKVKSPIFNDKKYATKDHKKNQEFEKKEQKPSLLDRLLSKIFTEKEISSEVEESKVEQVDSKKLNK